jgi:hypothetical protein
VILRYRLQKVNIGAIIFLYDQVIYYSVTLSKEKTQARCRQDEALTEPGD